MRSQGVMWPLDTWDVLSVQVHQGACVSHSERGRYKKVMIEEVMLAMKTHMPRLEGCTIFVEQDMEKPHTKGGITESIEEVAGDNIPIYTLSANSQDLNDNDLGFFHSNQ
ncbi:unnamed protein product [Choristocarpus tenellus]